MNNEGWIQIALALTVHFDVPTCFHIFFLDIIQPRFASENAAIVLFVWSQFNCTYRHISVRTRLLLLPQPRLLAVQEPSNLWFWSSSHYLTLDIVLDTCWHGLLHTQHCHRAGTDWGAKKSRSGVTQTIGKFKLTVHVQFDRGRCRDRNIVVGRLTGQYWI